MSGETVLELEGVTRVYGEQPEVSSISAYFDVNAAGGRSAIPGISEQQEFPLVKEMANL